MGHHLFCEVRSPGSCSPVTIRVPNIFTLYYALSGVSRGLPVKKHLCYIVMAVFARMDILHALKEGVPNTTSRLYLVNLFLILTIAIRLVNYAYPSFF